MSADVKKSIVLTIILISVIAWVMYARANSPASVVVEFANHISHKEFSEAKALGTEDTGKSIDLLMSMSMGNILEDGEYESIREEVNGDSAIVVVKNKDSGFTKKFNVKWVDGSWKVDLKK